MTIRLMFFGLLFLLTTAGFGQASLRITDLRCEYRVNPRGIDVAAPRLSWVLQSDQRGAAQSARQILVASSREKLNRDIGDVWDSGKIVSHQTVHVRFMGKLQSNRDYFWKVRVWDESGVVSEWSETAFWLTGLLQPGDWKAKWIGLDRPVGDDDPAAIGRPLAARILRREFTAPKKIKRAVVFVSGLGLFELVINGEKIGDQVLAPALSEYDKRAFYMTFDVTKNVLKGDNAIGVILGNGRYFAPRGEEPTKTRTFGFPKLRLQMEIEFADGSTATVISDENWKLTADGPIRANNEYDGEIYDARREMPGWANAGFDDAAWMPAELTTPPGDKLVAQPIEPIRVMETLKPAAMNQPKPGMFIFDMGQNMVGWARLFVDGAAGDSIKLRFAETLNADGTLFLDNIRGAKVTDVYVCKGSGPETWEPRFTYHGFRYVEMTGYPGTPSLGAIEGRVVHDDLEIVGQFESSNPLINQIYKNAFWGIRGNYRSIPTDCPQRDERQGWLGDRSAESRGESYIFNIAGLYNKWLVDMQDAQRDNGSLPDVAPSYWPMYSDNTTWPGSYIIIPAMLYEQYGDVETLRRHYPTMKKWMQYMHRYVKKGIMRKDTYGDWCVPPEDPHIIHSNDPRRTTSGEYIGTAYFYFENRLMQRFAVILGKEADADDFGRRAEEMKTAFNKKFLHQKSMQYANNSQTSNVLALAFDLVPAEYRSAIVKNLVDDIMGANSGHLGTGLIGCQWLMRTLSDYGHPGVAYVLAAQTSYPSWGYMVKNDATTIWELWNGNTGDPAMNSHNHVMLLGDLITWFYENLAGIKSDPQQPGFGRIILQPTVVGDLTFVKASLKSMHGPITSEWQRDGDSFSWQVAIPANTTALAAIPAESVEDVFESGQPVAAAKGVRFLQIKKHRALFEIASGKYNFSSRTAIVPEMQRYVRSPIILPSERTIARPEQVDVELACPTPQTEIHFTLDGTKPDKSSPVYQNPVRISENTIVKARAFAPGFHPSTVSTAIYDFVDPDVNGVAWKLIRGRFFKVAEFMNKEPALQGRAIQIDLLQHDFPKADFALLFEGYVNAPNDGLYTFYTNSNDGSQLFIDDQLVLDNDGEHGPTEMSGDIYLTAGKHKIKVAYFQTGGSQVLNVFYKGPGIEKRVLPGSALYQKK